MASTGWQFRVPTNNSSPDDYEIRRLIQHTDQLLHDARLAGPSRRGRKLLQEATACLQRIRQLEQKQPGLFRIDEYIRRLG
jgi:hypothetical protein